MEPNKFLLLHKIKTKGAKKSQSYSSNIAQILSSLQCRKWVQTLNLLLLMSGYADFVWIYHELW